MQALPAFKKRAAELHDEALFQRVIVLYALFGVTERYLVMMKQIAKRIISIVSQGIMIKLCGHLQMRTITLMAFFFVGGEREE